MPLGMQSVDWQQKPNARERVMFFATLAVFLLGFLKACWFPSRSAISDLHEEINKLHQEKKIAVQLRPAMPSDGTTPVSSKMASLVGVGSIQDVQMAIEKVAQPLLLKGVTLRGMKSADLERDGNMVRQKVELQLSGSFYSIGEYLEAIESLPSAFVIDDFSIALNDDKSGKVTAMIKGSFYGQDK